ncbi:hypothetical protein VE02_05178 [Pseudogymnoascus sp. 03VT05]|nr:hypothetical protein VE02_05178 [Pseudogymnoascus sp. 03VT05]
MIVVQDRDSLTLAVKGHCELPYRNTESYIGTIRLNLFGNIDRQLLRQYFLEQNMLANDLAQQQRMQTTDNDTEQAVSRQADEAQRFIFKDVNTAKDAHLVIVLTATKGNPITAKNITTGSRTSKWLGQMSDESLQTLSQNKMVNSSTPTNSAAYKQPDKLNVGFLKHGPGRIL